MPMCLSQQQFVAFAELMGPGIIEVVNKAMVVIHAEVASALWVRFGDVMCHGIGSAV